MSSPPDYLHLRRRMVDHQLKSRDIYHPLVLQAFASVPREKFVPRDLRQFAYDDRPLPIGQGQTISQPYVVALMVQLLLEDRPHFDPLASPVLEIGTGSGYQTAILCQVFSQVYTVERIKQLAYRARSRLNRLGYRNFSLRVGDGAQGWPRWKKVTQGQGFPAIIVSAAAHHLPKALAHQLANHGRLVIPLGDRWGQQLFKIIRQNHHLREEGFGPVAFVELAS